jgi:hypothetical protein
MRPHDRGASCEAQAHLLNPLNPEVPRAHHTLRDAVARPARAKFTRKPA